MSEHLEAWLERIEGKLDDLAVLPAQMEGLDKRLDEHIERDEDILHGNGQPGLVKDVDRLKQWRKSIYWMVGAVLTLASAPSLAEIVRFLLQGGK